MRFRKLKQGWALEEISGYEMMLLWDVAAVTESPDNKGSRRRLLPLPTDPEAAETKKGRRELDELLRDWEEFVLPEIEERFEAAIAEFVTDLGSASRESLMIQDALEEPLQKEEEASSLEKEEGEEVELEFYRIELPRDHAEHWYSALNQARILLSEKHGIDSEHHDDLLVELLTRSAEAGEKDEDPKFTESEEGRLRAFMQYQFYAAIQEWLILHLMAGGAPEGYNPEEDLSEEFGEGVDFEEE